MIPFVTPGLGRGGGIAYAAALAAVPNKTVILRGDTSSAADGVAIGASLWANEGSLGQAFTEFTGASVYWRANSQNGLRGVEITTGSNRWLRPAPVGSITRATAISPLDFTMWVVERRSGVQNQAVLLTEGFFNYGVGFDSSRQFRLFDGTNSRLTGLSFTDATPYVFAARVSASGVIRVNMNGSPASPSGSLTTPTSADEGLIIGQNPSSNANSIFLYEIIVSSSAVTDAQMDDLVGGLKTKWGI